jgi:SAM-dependent methyltransferase
VQTGNAYDEFGRGYSTVRRTDPRIAEAITEALGDAARVLNVGAGTGSYEPADRRVVAIEPSAEMLSQRSPDAAPAVRATAESLPISDKTVDASMAVLTIHHWTNLDKGLAELVRVTRDTIVVVTMDVECLGRHWFIRDYLPEVLPGHAESFPTVDRLLRTLPDSTTTVVPVPRNCVDGFLAAYWGRPEAYLDAAVRPGSSPWHQVPSVAVDRAVLRLSDDLVTGEWDGRYGHLRLRTELDVGLRIVRSDLSGQT